MAAAALTYEGLVREGRRRVEADAVPAWGVWGLLLMRSVVPLAVQVALTVVLLGWAGEGLAAAWRAAADWWLVGLTVANMACLATMAFLLRREGTGLAAAFNVERPGLRTLGWFLLAFLVSGPLAMVPNVVLAGWLFGDPAATMDLAFRPLPAPAVWALLAVFPLTQGLAELPTYFGYVMPRLEARTGGAWWAPWLPPLMLGVQHVFLPLLFDVRYLAWRLLMFLPFALWLAFVIRRRPGVLPYLVAGHVLLDATLPLMLLPR